MLLNANATLLKKSVYASKAKLRSKFTKEKKKKKKKKGKEKLYRAPLANTLHNNCFQLKGT